MSAWAAPRIRAAAPAATRGAADTLRGPSDKVFSVDAPFFDAFDLSPQPRTASIAPLRFSGWSPRFGRIRGELSVRVANRGRSVILDEHGTVRAARRPALFRGTITIGRRPHRRTAPVAASMRRTRGGGVSFELHALVASRRGALVAYTLRMLRAPDGGIRVREAATPLPRSKRGCDAVPLPFGSASVGAGPEHGRSSPLSSSVAGWRALELRLVADPQLTARMGNGDAVNQLLETHLNVVDTLYQSELGMDIHPVEFLSFWGSAPFAPASVADTLLWNFLEYSVLSGNTATADANVLVTGLGLGDYAGMAYIGTVCALPDYSVGFVSATPALQSILSLSLAHEIGHLVGASHDPAFLPGFIMSATYSPFHSFSFSAQSRGQISHHVASRGSCLASVAGGTPIPTAAPSATPSRTPTRTPSPTRTATPTWTPTRTATSIPPTAIPSPTRTPVSSPSVAPSPSRTPTRTPTRTATRTPTRTPSAVPTNPSGPSAEPTRVPTAAASPAPTVAVTVPPVVHPTVGVQAPIPEPPVTPLALGIRRGARNARLVIEFMRPLDPLALLDVWRGPRHIGTIFAGGRPVIRFPRRLVAGTYRVVLNERGKEAWAELRVTRPMLRNRRNRRADRS